MPPTSPASQRRRERPLYEIEAELLSVRRSGSSNNKASVTGDLKLRNGTTRAYRTTRANMVEEIGVLSKGARVTLRGTVAEGVFEPVFLDQAVSRAVAQAFS